MTKDMRETVPATSRPTVEVLMSTYNGARYLREQLGSIYAQEGVDVRLRVRDDGSSDDTQRLLTEEQKAGRLTWYAGANCGPAKSFWHLLCTAAGADYYAFADQDDVWDTDKLRVATWAIAEAGDEPALYFCQTQLVDEQLRELANVTIHPLLTYGEALAYQFIGGCTMVFNEPLRRLLAEYTPQYMRMHDIWAYDVALAVGAVVRFDATPHIRYRQHTGNAVGQQNSLRFRWRERWQHVKKNERIRSHTAEELWNGYAGKMTPANRDLTRHVVNYRRSLRSKSRLLFGNALHCADATVAVTSRVAILFNIF